MFRSERASATQNRGVRLQEGANINKSLLALANCINALAENGTGKMRKNVKVRGGGGGWHVGGGAAEGGRRGGREG